MHDAIWQPVRLSYLRIWGTLFQWQSKEDKAMTHEQHCVRSKILAQWILRDSWNNEVEKSAISSRKQRSFSVSLGSEKVGKITEDFVSQDCPHINLEFEVILSTWYRILTPKIKLKKWLLFEQGDNIGIHICQNCTLKVCMFYYIYIILQFKNNSGPWCSRRQVAGFYVNYS